MNVTPLAIAALTLGAVFFSPGPAHADDHPTPVTHDPLTTVVTESFDEPYLDCDDAMWYYLVTSYTYVETAPDVYAAPVITTNVEVWNTATGNSPDSDCPNWVIGEDGSWRNSEWKLGING